MRDRLTADEALAVFDLCKYVLHTRRVQEDVETSVLFSALHKLRDQAKRLLCEDCADAPVHANGQCEACYRYEKRTGNKRPVPLAC